MQKLPLLHEILPSTYQTVNFSILMASSPHHHCKVKVHTTTSTSKNVGISIHGKAMPSDHRLPQKFLLSCQNGCLSETTTSHLLESIPTE